jgi:ABC-type proline/glycine betaine transport system ATPase subunit
VTHDEAEANIFADKVGIIQNKQIQLNNNLKK